MVESVAATAGPEIVGTVIELAQGFVAARRGIPAAA
jgi:hypothetical protein